MNNQIRLVTSLGFAVFMAGSACSQTVGKPLWWRGFGGGVPGNDIPIASASGPFGNIFALGTVQNATKDVLLVSYAPNGQLRWYAGMDRTLDDEAIGLATVDDGVLVNARLDEPSSINDYQIIKFDNEGVSKWTIKFNFPGILHSEGSACYAGVRSNGAISATWFDDETGVVGNPNLYDGPGADKVNNFHPASNAIDIFGSRTNNGKTRPLMVRLMKSGALGRVRELLEYEGEFTMGFSEIAVGTVNDGKDIIVHDAWRSKTWIYNGPGNGIDTPVAVAMVGSPFQRLTILATSTSALGDTDIALLQLDAEDRLVEVFREDLGQHKNDRAVGMCMIDSELILLAEGEVYPSNKDLVGFGFPMEYEKPLAKRWRFQFGGAGEERGQAISSGFGDIGLFGSWPQGTTGFRDMFLSRIVSPAIPRDDEYGVLENSSQTYSSVMANDAQKTDAVPIVSSQPTHGAITLLPDGKFTYTPNPGFFGYDYFRYRLVKPGSIYSNAAVVKLSVGAVPTSIGLSPSNLIGGNQSRIFVHTLVPPPPEGVVVTLTDDTSLINTPSSLLVKPSENSVVITTLATATTVTRHVYAQRGPYKVSANMTLTPGGLGSFVLNPTSVTGGASSVGTLKITGPVLFDTHIAVSDNTSVIGVPADVPVYWGTTQSTFVATTLPVSTTVTRQIYAQLGTVTLTANLTLQPKPSLATLSLSPSLVKGGLASTGTVTLSSPASTGGITVALSDNTSVISEPASVLVASGTTSKTFGVATSAVTATVTRQVSATYNGVTKTANLTLTP